MLPFDADRIAYLEAASWRAYYDRRWLRLLRLMVALCQEQFHVPFPLSLLGAYHLTRAAMAWAPVESDIPAAIRSCERFYRLARRFSGLRYDPDRVARHEVQWWIEHRRLVGQADKAAFVDALADLHGAMFGLSPERARPSAEWRVRANDTVDRITGHTSTDVEGDWARLEDDLRRCYRSILEEMRQPPARGGEPARAAGGSPPRG